MDHIAVLGMQLPFLSLIFSSMENETSNELGSCEMNDLHLNM